MQINEENKHTAVNFRLSWRKPSIILVFILFMALYYNWVTIATGQEPPRPNNLNFNENSSFNIFVSKNGKDKNPGTEELPFLTVQKAADVAKPGDSILIKEGIYREFVTIKKSGEVSKRITFSGERGPNGEYKSIIDPSTPIGNWLPASEIGNGVYKTRIGFDPREMTVDHKRIGRINDKLMSDGSGFKMLARAPNDEIDYEGSIIKFWDGLEVLYGYKDGITFLRFRGEDNPNEKKIKAAPEGSAIKIDNSSHITICNFQIKGAQKAIMVKGSGSSDVTIENSHLSNGNARISFLNGPRNNIIRNNTITMNYYAPKFLGAGESHGYEDLIRRYVYYNFKFVISSVKTSDDVGIRMVNSGPGNIITNNLIFGGLIGVSAYARKIVSPIDGLEVSHNIINNMSSVGITSSEGIINAKYHDNIVYNCNINIRLHDINKSTDIGRKVYIYNNRLWNHAGYHFYVHTSTTKNPVKYPEYFIYHNSLSGGRFIGIMEGLRYNGGMPKTHIMNNIISVENPNDASLVFLIDHNLFGSFAHNWIGGKLNNDSITVYGKKNNLKKDRYIWKLENIRANYFDYGLDEFVKNGGLDLSKPFIYNDNHILPGMKEAYFEKIKIPIGIYMR